MATVIIEDIYNRLSKKKFSSDKNELSFSKMLCWFEEKYKTEAKKETLELFSSSFSISARDSHCGFGFYYFNDEEQHHHSNLKRKDFFLKNLFSFENCSDYRSNFRSFRSANVRCFSRWIIRTSSSISSS